ncbi:MAG TPA: tripartite tricarboxylate transporter substrate binding protein [Pseudorhodoferax sp.]|jgi:tripartite-type tricarboxylate transporter receptor subunit TctC|nr:tripartite tricarboxylate transporter substrate binding protein [Pseudorhodoferax sp.]
MPQQLRPGATRRSVLLAGVSAATAIAAPAFAQGAYPNKPIEFIVPFPPGGGTDALARTLAEASRKYLPQSLVIINKAGASGGVGWAELVAARPDGYKIGIITVEITIIPHMGGVRFTSDDVTPIARLNADPATIAVRADSPIRTIEDLLAASKKAGGEGLKVGNAGPGSLGHLAAVVLSDKTGVPFTHVPYRGAGPGLLDLTGGHVDALSLTPPDMAAFVADGKVRPLAVMGAQRIGSGWEQVPTAKERGIDVLVTGWRGLAAPKGTPPEVIAVLRQAVAKAMQEPALKETMHKLNLKEGYLDQPEFRTVMEQDNAMYRALINKLNLKV